MQKVNVPIGVDVLLAAVLLLAVALVVLLAIGYRIAAHVGPLDLEDYARRNHVIYIPVSAQLAVELEKDWSQPIRMRLNTGRHKNPILAELICKTLEADDV